jgi:hypothetical protein
VISFWNSFIGSSNDMNLVWSFKYDHSPKVRLIASNALTVYLECVKAFFTIAASEDNSSAGSLQPSVLANSQTASSGSFLPISYTIAALIRQLHKDLMNSLRYREQFTLNQIQLLKCLKCLIKATPYAKLKPGLVYRLVMSLNLILCQKCSQQKYTKDVNNANLISEVLNCLELILTNNSQMIEVHLALLAPNLSKTNEDVDLSSKIEELKLNFKLPNLTQSRVTYFYEGNVSFSGSNSSFKSSLNCSTTTSGHMTPLINDLLNEETPNESEQPNGTKSWLVSFCLRNSSFLEAKQQAISPGCLDLLVVVCRKYFDIIRKEVFFEDMCKLILDK